MSADSETPQPPAEAPWVAGWQAAKANLVPGLVIQAIMLALLLAYYFYPPTTDLLNRLAGVKQAWGYGYSLVSAAIAGAVIPEILRIVLLQGRRVTRANLSNFLFSAVYWGVMGMVVDFFYRLQARWFGEEASFEVVAKKVLVDQFLYNPLFAAPVVAILYDWKNSGYRVRGFGRFFTWRYYKTTVIPTLFATWGVWIPIITIIYSLPSLLQIPLFGLALSLWVMLYTWMSERRAG
ncbi:MAG: hypothetical protein QM627_02525 [Luteolibacter sp.]